MITVKLHDMIMSAVAAPVAFMLALVDFELFLNSAIAVCVVDEGAIAANDL